jgi:CNT family concentrative nucleoside transporter
MNRILILFFIILLVLNRSVFAANYQPDSSVANKDSIGLMDTTSSGQDTMYGESPSSIMKSKLIDENKQVIPRNYQFNFNIINILRGLLGMLVLVFIAFLFSTNRKAISWKVVGTGLAIQILLAVGILWIPAVQVFFEIVGRIFVKVIDFTMAGTEFLFKSNASGKIEPPLLNFVVTILPTIIFFSALTSVLFYFGIIQAVVYGLAWALSRAFKLSGAESLAVAGNIFLGQTESPLMIKAYLEKMNRSEIHLVMSAGMATLAGGVLAVYINVLGGDDPVQRLIFAKHLIAASVMAAPGVVVISKILVPQTENVEKTVKISKDIIGKNVLDAIATGTYQGVKLAVNVAAMLLVFLAFIAMINYIFMKIGDWTTLNHVISNITHGQYEELSLQFLLGYTFAPVMWLVGICTEDITLVGRLLGEKIILTEFIGYISLADMKASGIFAETKSIIMATYILCGFANFASIGIQIGGIGALAPGQRLLLSQYGLRALLCGTLASLLSATIIGMILS